MFETLDSARQQKAVSPGLTRLFFGTYGLAGALGASLDFYRHGLHRPVLWASKYWCSQSLWPGRGIHGWGLREESIEAGSCSWWSFWSSHISSKTSGTA